MGTSAEAPLILVIDDDEAVLQVYRDVLEDDGYRLSLRVRPPSSIAEVRQARPDLILLDLLFGYEDVGWHFLQLLKDDASTAGIPVVVATADHRLAAQIQPQLDAWGCGVVLKPFDIDDLSSAVHDAIASR